MAEKQTFNFGSSGLIQLVEARPCLWDQSRPDYKMRHIKELAWREIYCAMEPKFEILSEAKQIALGTQITHRWYNIRDAYVKWMKGGCGKGKRTKPYLYHEYLAFYKTAYLNEHEQLERSLQEVSEDETAARTLETLEYNQDANDVEDDNVLDNEDVLALVVSESSESRPGASKRSYSELDPMAEILLKLLKKFDDEDEAFFSSLLPDVRKMSESVKYEFRIEVLRLVKRLKRRGRVKSEETDSD